jgi:hypothetical protein
MTPQGTDTGTVNETPAAQELSAKDRQAIVMTWAFGSLGLFLLLDSLALVAAAVFHAGFVGWLIGTGAMGLVMVVVIAAANSFVSRADPRARHQLGEASEPYPPPSETSLL